MQQFVTSPAVIDRRYSYLRLLVVLLAFMGLCAVNAQAQEAPSSGRIVEGRPRLYTFKNRVNPLTWVEWGVEPLFRSAERGWIRRLAGYHPPPDKVVGVKFGLHGT